MDKDTDTGGPAFPTTQYKHGGESDGMELRDYFAAKAMQGSLAAAEGEIHDSSMFAHWCYALADAMLKAREA